MMHAPTQACWDAGFAAGLVASFLESGLSMPVELAEIRSWFVDGHWVAGFESGSGCGLQRLMVL